MITGTWGSFEAEKTFDTAVSEDAISAVVLLPAEHGSFSSGGRLQTSAGDFHIKIFIVRPGKTLKNVKAMRDEEARILKALDGADGYAPKLHMTGTFTDIDGNACPALVMDRIEGANLYEYVESASPPLSGKRAAQLAEELARGIAACASKGITHRDLWPANILVKASSEGGFSPAFVDFGSSTESCRSAATALGANLRLARQNYGAPEVFSTNGRDRRKRNAASVDVWSLGALIYYLRTGQDPVGYDPVTNKFVDPSVVDYLDQRKLNYLVSIKSRPLDMLHILDSDQETLTNIDYELAWLVARCTEAKPLARPKIEDLVDELHHLAFEVEETPVSKGTPLMASTSGGHGNTAKMKRRYRRLIVKIAVAVVVVAVIAVAGLHVAAHNVSWGRVGDLQESYAYTGEVQQPKVLVSNLFGQLLEEGRDYVVTYSQNESVGTASLTINGIGSYYGTRSASFSIVKASLSQAKLKLSKKRYTYTGKRIKPAVTVTLDSEQLAAGEDYEVSYSHNKKPGTAKVTVTGKGNYAGEASITFVIKKKAKAKTASSASSTSSTATSYASTSSSGSTSSGADTSSSSNSSDSSSTDFVPDGVVDLSGL